MSNAINIISEKLKKMNVYILFSFFFIIFSIIVFFPVWIRGDGLIAVGDSFNQNYPILKYLARFYQQLIPNLLHGKFIMYDTSIGFGDDVIGSLSWFGLGDIFLIHAAFFPQKYMAYAYTFTILLRFYLSGITFIFYLQYKNISKKRAVLGALMYVFCGYALGNGLIFLPFSSVMVIFPLMVYGFEQIIMRTDSRKWSLVFIIAVFLQALDGFYFLYIDILFFVAYFFLMCIKWYRKKESTKKVIQNSALLFIHFAIGTSMAAVILIPVVVMYLQCARTGDSKLSFGKIIRLPSEDELHVALSNLISPAASAYQSGAAFSIIVILFFVYMIRNFRRWKSSKTFLIYVIAIWGYFFPTIGMVTNGFAYITSRWFYIMFFWITIVIIQEYPKYLDNHTKKDEYISILVMILWNISQLYFKGLNSSTVVRIILYDFIFILYIYTLSFSRNRKEAEKKVNISGEFWWILICNVLLTAFLTFAPVRIGGSGLGASFMKMNEAEAKIANSDLAGIAKSNTKNINEFNRIDYNDTALNAPIDLGINSTYLYYSMCNGSILNFFTELRISPAIMQSFILQGLDGRQILESLLSVRQYGTDIEKKIISKNQYYLPLGYTYNNVIYKSMLENKSPLQKMNCMLSTIIIDDKEATKEEKKEKMKDKTTESFMGIQKTYPIRIAYDDTIQQMENGLYIPEGAKIHIKFDPASFESVGSELYIYIRNLTADTMQNADIVVGGKTIRIRKSEEEWYYNNNYDYLIQIQNSAKTGEVDMLFQKSGIYSFDNIEVVQNTVDEYENKISKLKENTLQNLTEDINTFSGKIKLDTDKWLFMSLPYSKGWKCTIDGQMVDIVRANYSFMAVYVPEGIHNIVFIYTTPGIYLGMTLSIIGTFAFCVIVILWWREKKNV